VDTGMARGFDPPFDHGLAHKCVYYSLRVTRGVLGSFHG
jgi:hypothetical protein